MRTKEEGKRMAAPAPALSFGVTPLTGDGIPAENTEAFRMLLDEGLAGGTGTANYLQHMLKLASFSTYLSKNGESAFTVSPGPGGGEQATASDGVTTLTVGVILDPPPAGAAAADGPPVRGVATVRLALPHPYNVVKIAQFAVSLAELPPDFVLTQQVWQALLKPLLSRFTGFLRAAVDSWLETDVGEDVAGLTDSLDAATSEVADATAEEAAEVLVEEEVVAEVAIDLSAAVPALAGLAVLLAIPLLISALAKQFVLHIEVNNLTDDDLTWSLPYTDEGAVTVQPASSVLPKMGRATDSWGDETTVPVVFQAIFSSMNTSGYEGIGLVLNLSPAGYTGQDTCAVISIPWLADNAVWLGDPGRTPDWAAIYSGHSAPTGATRVFHGNQHFSVMLAIDALSGHNDEYHCVARIQRL
jgi:hypothetical protein